MRFIPLFFFLFLSIFILIHPAHAEVIIGTEKIPTFIPSEVTTDSPVINGYLSSYFVAKGDYFRVKGNISQGSPEYVVIWAFGRNYFFVSTPVKTIQNRYEYVFQGRETGKMGILSSENDEDYYIVVQHPGANDQQDIYYENNSIRIKGDNETELDVRFYPPLMLKDKFEGIFNKTDDKFTEIPFRLVFPWLKISDMENTEPTQRTVWNIQSMDIRGITNLNGGTPLILRIDPEMNGKGDITSVFEGTFQVKISDTGYNTFSYMIPLRGLKKGIHQFQIYDKYGLTSVTTPFQLYEDIPEEIIISTETPTPTPTPTPTANVTKLITPTANVTTIKPVVVPEKPDYSFPIFVIVMIIIGFVIWLYFG